MKRAFLAEGVLPLAGFAAVAAWALRSLVRAGEWLSPLPTAPMPSDAAGTVWFYWWLKSSVLEGRYLLHSTLTCGPSGEMLGNNFPSRVDAWLAFPWMATLPIDRAIVLHIGTLYALAAWAGFFFLRGLGVSHLLAWAAAIPIGFTSYAANEVLGGRPVTAMIFQVPLLFGCLLRARTGHWGWAVATAGAAALVVHAYAPLALGCIPVALGLWLAAGRQRLGLGVATAVVAAALTMPYLHEVRVARYQPRGQTQSTWASWNPANWLDEGTTRPPREAPKANAGPPLWEGVQTESLLWNALWTPSLGTVSAAAWVWWPMLLAGVGFGLIAPKARWWLAGAVLWWLITLGPNAATYAVPENVRYATVDGRLVPLPLSLVLRAVPGLEAWLRPARFTVFTLMFGAAAIALGAERLRVRARWGVDIGMVVLAGAYLWGMERHQGFLARSFGWDVPKAVLKLRDDGQDYWIAEVPAGMGHAYGIYQATHQKGRLEPLHDVFKGERDAAPPRCFAGAFGQAVWEVGKVGAGNGGGDLSGLKAAGPGYRYLLYYPKVAEREWDGRARSWTLAAAQLRAALGEPVVRDEDAWVFELR